MITRRMVQRAYDRGIAKLEISPHKDGVVCRIGEYWFYFGGMAAAICESVEKYKADIPRKSIINNIHEALCEFKRDESMIDEYGYYEAIMRESGCDKR